MHRQLSSVMCMVPATNASVLIVCCRKHCSCVHEYINCDVAANRAEGEKCAHKCDISRVRSLLPV